VTEELLLLNATVVVKDEKGVDIGHVSPCGRSVREVMICYCSRVRSTKKNEMTANTTSYNHPF